MQRLVLFVLAFCGGVAAFCWALLFPAHLRSLDADIVEREGKGTPSFVEFASRERNPDVLQLHAKAAGELKLPGHERLARLALILPSPTNEVWGIPLETDLALLPIFMLEPHRKLQEVQRGSNPFEVAAILRTARFTNLTVFGRSGTAAGQAYDAAVLISAAMIAKGQGSPKFRSGVIQMMSRADAQEIESFYLDMIALGKRLSWNQFAALLDQVESVDAFAMTAESFRNYETELTMLYSAGMFLNQPGAVAEYALRFGGAGLRDIEFGLRHGEGALKRIIQTQTPIWHPYFRETLQSYSIVQAIYRPLIDLTAKSPVLALFLKYDLVFLGAFLVAYSVWIGKSRKNDAANYVWFPQFRFAREALFGVFVIMLMLAIGEPYLAQGDTKPDLTPKWNLSLMAQAAPSNVQSTSTNMLDQYTILALVTFLVLQGIIYIVCLLKLAEIRRQPLSSSMKLKLLDNEENLFDAGLYCGLFGTVGSLVFLALGILKPSLMAAYSSTLFGILFVAILKIVHVRPYKRRLLLESSTQEA